MASQLLTYLVAKLFGWPVEEANVSNEVQVSGGVQLNISNNSLSNSVEAELDLSHYESSPTASLKDSDRVYDLEKIVELERSLQTDQRQALLKYEGNDAQKLLDFSHWVLTSWKPEGPLAEDEARWEELRRGIHRLIVRLIQFSKLLPSGIYLDFNSLEIDRVPVRDGETPAQSHFNQTISSGAYADVYKGKYNGQPVAVKRFRKCAMESQAAVDVDQVSTPKRIAREVAIQRYLNHPNICCPLGVMRDNPDDDSLYFVYPLMPKGDVMQYVKESKPALPKMYQLFYQIALALEHTHRANVTHGDLHARNVLIDDDGNARLTDYGIANFADSTMASVSMARSGADRWMAPEILEAVQQRNYSDSDTRIVVSHTPASDVYSFGMCMLQIMTGAKPFGAIPCGTARRRILQGNLPPQPQNVCDDLWDIISECWSYHADYRPSATQVASRLQVLRDQS